MQGLLDAMVGGIVAALVLAGLAGCAVAMWIRAIRRRARARVERTMDRLATQVTRTVSDGRAPGWAHWRYARLGEDARVATTWSALQWLVVRERMLGTAYDVAKGAAGRVGRRMPAGRR
jgi:hypothetical protein